MAGSESRDSVATATMCGEAPRPPGASSSMSSVVMIASAAPPFLFWWVLMCLERWSLRMKRLEHSGHSNRFSPARVKSTQQILEDLLEEVEEGQEEAVEEKEVQEEAVEEEEEQQES